MATFLDQLLSNDSDRRHVRTELARDPAHLTDELVSRLSEHELLAAMVGAEPETKAEKEFVRRTLLSHVTSSAVAMEKLEQSDSDDDVSKQDRNSLETIVLLMLRPAILIQDSHFLPAPDPWTTELEAHRESIEQVLPRVGRIEVEGHPTLDWLGTGWLAADRVIMTNRHVAIEFARGSGKSWKFLPGMSARIDYNEQLSAGFPQEVRIEGVLGVHPTVDLALLRVAKAGRHVPHLDPLPVAAEPQLKKGDHVYVVGYPHRDSRRNDEQEMDRVFNNIYNVKRLQPGAMKTVPRTKLEFLHDCSTLGGNSGSCVVSLETGTVLGLHFGGRYLKENRAVALWQLRKDPMLVRAGVNFV